MVLPKHGLKIKDRVRIVQSEDGIYKNHIGLEGEIIDIRNDTGGSDLPIDVRFDKVICHGSTDSFYPEELEKI